MQMTPPFPYILITVFMFIIRCPAFAQNSLTGTVIDEEGKAIERVSVVIKDEQGKILSYAITDIRGIFSIKLPNSKNASSISFNHMGFQSRSLSLNEYQEGQRTTLTSRPFNIKEVTVKAKGIRLEGDTLTYRVSAFEKKQDKYIEDVIARLPGVEVSPSGTISYQGKPINKFMVEGIDLMGKKYSQISRNLTADKVKNIQIYENHQPVKMLRGVVLSDQAAMNLQLKDDAKNSIIGVIDAGTGLSMNGNTEWLRDARCVEMGFGKKMQNLNMYKTNNIGTDISTESISSETGYKGIIRNPVLRGDERNTYNDSHLISTNCLLKKRDTDLRLQISGFHDKTTQKRYQEMHYNDVDYGQVLSEHSELQNIHNQWDAELLYHQNGSRTNIRNTLSGSIDADNSYGHHQLNGKDSHAATRLRQHSIDNEFHLGKTFNNNKTLNIQLYAGISNQPSNMLLYNGCEQKTNLNIMEALLTAQFLHRLGQWASIGLSVKERSKAEWMDVEYEDYSNKDCYACHWLSIYPRFAFQSMTTSFIFEPEANILIRSIGNHQDRQAYFNPQLKITREITEGLRVNAEYQYKRNGDESIGTITSIPFYSSYNYMIKGSGELPESSFHKVGGSMSFRDINHSFFAYFGINADFIKNRLYESNLSDGLYQRELSKQTQLAKTYGIRWAISKQIPFWMLSTTMEGVCSWNNFYVMHASTVSPICNNYKRIAAKIRMNPSILFSVEMLTSVNFFHQGGNQLSFNKTSFCNYTEKVNLFFLPGKWQIGWVMQYDGSNDSMQTHHLFCDVSLSYRTKRNSIGLFLNNIFNCKDIKKRQFNEQGESFCITYLRPCELMIKTFFKL